MKVAGVRVRGAAVLYVLAEDAFIVAALLGAFAFAHFGRIRILESPLGILNAVCLLIAIKAAFFWTGLYDFGHRADRRTFWRRLFTGFAVVYTGTWLMWCVVTDEFVACAAFLAIFAPMVVLGRLGYEFVAHWAGYRRRLLFLGVGEQARRTARELLDLRNRDHEIVGFLGETADESGWRIGGKSVLGVYADLEQTVREHRVDQVVVAIEDRRRQLPLEALLRVRLQGVSVVEEAKIHEDIAGKIPIDDLRPSWLIFSEGFVNNRLRNVDSTCLWPSSAWC